MKLKIHQRKSDKNNSILYRKAVEFFVCELLSKANQEALTLSISFKKFRGKDKEDHGETDQISRYNYKMEINNTKPFHSIISTLAHECVHVKQGVKGWLECKAAMPDIKWKKASYDVDNMSTEEYNNLEWEAEARSLEIELTQKFLKTVVIPEVKALND